MRTLIKVCTTYQVRKVVSELVTRATKSCPDKTMLTKVRSLERKLLESHPVVDAAPERYFCMILLSMMMLNKL